MRQFLAIIKKEFIQIRRDPRTLGIVLFAPVVMLMLYGYAINYDIRHIGIVVCDQDHSPASRKFVQGLSSSEYFDILGYIDEPSKLIDYLDTGKARAILWLPRGFGRKINSGKSSEVFVGMDGTDSNTATIAYGYLAGYIRDYSSKLNLSRLEREGKTFLKKQLMPFQVEHRVWYNPGLKSSHFIVPGLISVLLMMMVGMLTAITITGEKERNTFEQLAASPVHPWHLILGKILPYALVSFAGVLLIIPAGIFLFGVPLHGSILVLFLAIFLFLLTVLGIGLLVSTIAKTQQQAMFTIAAVTFIPAMLLSGFVFPIESMPWTLQILSNLVPAKFFLIALRGIFLKGIGMEILWPQFLAMFVFMSALIIMASLRFKKRLD